MNERNIDACIIPSGDPHLSEYPTAHWKIREWISGFTGSAGTLVVTKNEAGLWTDSRYWLQAEQQLDSNQIKLYQDGKEEVLSVVDWLFQNLEPESRIGINNALFSVEYAQELTEKFQRKQINLVNDFTAPQEIWEERPKMPTDMVTAIPDHLTGLSRTEKINQIKEVMKKNDITYYATGALDEIAWTLNLRGADVPYNPVFYAFMIISNYDIKLYIDTHKLSNHVSKKLTDEGIKIRNYEQFYEFLNCLSLNSTLLIDPKRTNMATLSAVSTNATIIQDDSIISNIKAIKNETEIDNIRQTMIKDGIAMVRFLSWLHKNIEKKAITEVSASKKIAEFRKEQSGYTGDSFETISAFRENGAIVHYCATPDNDTKLELNGIFLLDSGGQYITGTTDITRTVALGNVSQQAIIDYTLVLKGHIAIAEAIFPVGTRGAQIDILARKELWKNGLKYDHGTGHGVGYYLNVHEGPQSIRTQENPVTLKPGMITSNEPAIYRNGEYGIRIENLILCVEIMETNFGKFLGFETLTLCPLDKNLICKELLAEEEIQWINNYHKKVYETLGPLILCDCQEWLKEVTLPI
ncbi:MAG: aminopeptidase P family protein [Marinilabiliaceae bacterium]|nr:aminopeptidase P family protein [Marinilabiliaceae bacterium]